MAMPFRIIGFDLDGTLVDSSPDLAAAVNHALAAVGRPPLTVAQVRPMIGGGSRAMLRHGLEASGGCDPAELERLVPLLLDHYHDHIADAGSALFPGAEAALDALAADGVRLAVVTNKLERLARRLLDALGLTDRFDCVIGGDTMGPGRCKPDAAPIREMIARCGGGSAAFVGDSVFDVGAARAAGIPVLACAFGFLDRPVEALGADGVIAHYDQFLPALERLA